MPSHLIIGSPDQTHGRAQSLAPFSLVSSADCLIASPEGSLKIADVRNIKQFLTRKPYQHDHQLIYIPASDRLTIPAQNALLKTLEEPPKHAIVILTTNLPDRLLPTIISRCYIHTLTSQSEVRQAGQEFSPIYDDLKRLSNGEKILLAQTYAYPKTKAVTICQEAIAFFRHRLYSTKASPAAKNATLAHKMLLYIESNADPKLCLEHLFLNLV